MLACSYESPPARPLHHRDHATAGCGIGDPSGDASLTENHRDSYWRFIRQERTLLLFGLSLTFLSSVGQTFLVSLFVPGFLREFAFSEAEFGVLYAVATLTSALLLPWFGQWLDRTSLHHFTWGVVMLLAGSAFLIAAARHVAVLALALTGLRLAGQGLSSHTALTTMARHYHAARGRALSVSSLGFPLGEGVLPLLLVGSIGFLGGRATWVVIGAAVLLFGPFLVRLLQRSGVELDPRVAAHPAPAAPAAGNPDAPAWGRREVLRDPRFWLVLPLKLLPPFWITGLFLYQTTIAGLRGWSLPLMASAFLAFALTRVGVTVAAGPAVDWFSARRLLPVTVLPLGFAMGLLWLGGGVWVAYAFMTLLGATLGLSGAVHTAFWAELYGTRHLGAIQSMQTALMVLSTAASPVVVGLVLERGAGLDGLLAAGVVSVVVGALLALRVVRDDGP